MEILNFFGIVIFFVLGYLCSRVFKLSKENKKLIDENEKLRIDNEKKEARIMNLSSKLEGFHY